MRNTKNLNIPDPDLPPVKEDFTKTFPWRIFKIMAEFIEGFEFINGFKTKSATVFGATRFSEDNEYYKKARKLGELLSKEGYIVVSGGGPGIMEAANRGAYEVGGESVGMNIELPGGQRTNPFVKKAVGFYYFFTRKVMMSFASSVYIFFPGGFGTLDEFFEMVTLLQTRKLSHPVKIIVVGKDYWGPMIKWFEEELCNKQQSIAKKDLKLFKLVDTPEEVIKYIKNNKK